MCCNFRFSLTFESVGGFASDTCIWESPITWNIQTTMSKYFSVDCNINKKFSYRRDSTRARMMLTLNIQGHSRSSVVFDAAYITLFSFICVLVYFMQGWVSADRNLFLHNADDVEFFFFFQIIGQLQHNEGFADGDAIQFQQYC